MGYFSEIDLEIKEIKEFKPDRENLKALKKYYRAQKKLREKINKKFPNKDIEEIEMILGIPLYFLRENKRMSNNFAATQSSLVEKDDWEFEEDHQVQEGMNR